MSTSNDLHDDSTVTPAADAGPRCTCSHNYADHSAVRNHYCMMAGCPCERYELLANPPVPQEAAPHISIESNSVTFGAVPKEVGAVAPIGAESQRISNPRSTSGVSAPVLFESTAPRCPATGQVKPCNSYVCQFCYPQTKKHKATCNSGLAKYPNGVPKGVTADRNCDCGAMRVAEQKAFSITWDEDCAQYRVNIPRYYGGKVVRLEDVAALIREAGSERERVAGATAAQFIEGKLTAPFLHGDQEHQDWLREETRKWIPELAALMSRRDLKLREALRIAAIFAPHNHPFVGDITPGCPKCEASRLLGGESNGTKQD